MPGVSLRKLPIVDDLRGLSVGEFDRRLPFVPCATSWSSTCRASEVRGEHAHRSCTSSWSACGHAAPWWSTTACAARIAARRAVAAACTSRPWSGASSTTIQRDAVLLVLASDVLRRATTTSATTPSSSRSEAHAMTCRLVPFLDLKSDPARRAASRARRRVQPRAATRAGTSSAPRSRRFEQEFARYCGAAHCVGVGNGLDALTLVLRALGIGAGDEVIVPVQHLHRHLARGEPRAAPRRCRWSPTRDLQHRPGAHRGGASRRARGPSCRCTCTASPPTWTPISTSRGAAACACSRTPRRRTARATRAARAGALGDAAGLSFYPGKNLGAFGDGGAVHHRRRGARRPLRVLRNYGSRVKYHNEVVGYNSASTSCRPRCCARSCGAWTTGTRAVAWWRRLPGGCCLKRFPEVALPVIRDWSRDVLAPVRRPGAGPSPVQAALADRGVQTLVHYPVPPQPAGRRLRAARIGAAFPHRGAAGGPGAQPAHGSPRGPGEAAAALVLMSVHAQSVRHAPVRANTGAWLIVAAALRRLLRRRLARPLLRRHLQHRHLPRPAVHRCREGDLRFNRFPLFALALYPLLLLLPRRVAHPVWSPPPTRRRPCCSAPMLRVRLLGAAGGERRAAVPAGPGAHRGAPLGGGEHHHLRRGPSCEHPRS